MDERTSLVFFGENRGEENACLFHSAFRAPRHRGCRRRLSGRPWSLALESGRARCYSLLLSLSTLSCLVLSCPIPTKYRTYLVHYARLARAELGTGFSTGSLLFLSLSLSTKSHRYLLRSDQITGWHLPFFFYRSFLFFSFFFFFFPCIRFLFSR